jgi:transposase-like protein
LRKKGRVMMESVKEVKRKRKNKRGKESRYGNRYGFELKLPCVKLHLEKGLPVSLLSKEVEASRDTILDWMKAYRERGEGGLRNEVSRSGSRRKQPGPVRKKIIEIKKREPFLGVQRISHLFKRVFFLSASPETVRRTLQEESLIVPSRKKPSRNITRLGFLRGPRRTRCGRGIFLPFVWEILGNDTIEKKDFTDRRRIAEEGLNIKFLFFNKTAEIVNGGVWGRRPRTLSEPVLLVSQCCATVTEPWSGGLLYARESKIRPCNVSL